MARCFLPHQIRVFYCGGFYHKFHWKAMKNFCSSDLTVYLAAKLLTFDIRMVEKQPRGILIEVCCNCTLRSAGARESETSAFYRHTAPPERM